MLAAIELVPKQGSTIAPKIDELFYFITAVSVFFTALIAILILVLAVRFRRRAEDEVPPHIKEVAFLEVIWSVIPLLICLVMFYWGADLFFTMHRPPDDAMEIYVTGRQWMWKLEHPTGEAETNTLHVPVGVPVKLTMTSEDVIHSFSVPAFRVKQDVLPGRYTTLWFEATKVDTYHLFCTEYCGTRHSTMIGQVIVMEQSDYQNWLALQADRSLALEGAKLFKKLQCITCHTGTVEAKAPLLEGIYMKNVTLTDGNVVRADDNYIRESIIQPAAKVVAGYKPIMPTYQDLITEGELIKVLAYLKSYKPGQTLPRVEQTKSPPDAKESMESKDKDKKK